MSQPKPLTPEDVAKRLEALAYSVANKEASKIRQQLENSRGGLIRERSIRSR